MFLVHNETLRSHTTESEEQLENLVRELKAMSQTKYPTTNTLMHHQQQHFVNGNGSSQGSFNQNEVVMEDELQVCQRFSFAGIDRDKKNISCF